MPCLPEVRFDNDELLEFIELIKKEPHYAEHIAEYAILKLWSIIL